MAKMCRVSIHLLIGVFLVLNNAVENEAMNTIATMEPTPAPVSMPHDNTTKFKDTSEYLEGNFTSSINANSTFLSQNTTVTTSAEDSGSPTPPTSKNPHTSNDTTPVPPTSTTSKIQLLSTTSKIAKTTRTSKTLATTTIVPEHSYGSAYIIILIIIVVLISGIIVYFCLQKNTRRYFLDLHPKQEDAQIPLSIVDGDVFDSTSVKDMQPFCPAESSMPLKGPEPVKDDEKPRGEKETADVQTGHHENSQVKENPKAEELTVVDLTDGELAISTKTSMESLDEPLNENNSNNSRFAFNDYGHEFTEICLDGLL
ncbi:uncharacterized protein LOC127651287 isoform X2 [Xyrauchen texanus]|uniref:uncharacterized protein LOC127651287 isoform X2 n=1 Tax=Xyrauchen texanus TaxID=154827 RepID=UPI002242B74E|nr:uncharacterized protein LOC127651287 isoform X2 [Xyrauchen texanus]XP_051993019.1 uncharacterized protein LOC127651287 isoform X2 [Xyrauchen texanus]